MAASVDVVPALLEEIQSDFQRAARSAQLMRLSARIRDGTATLADVHRYSSLLGDALSQSLRATLTEDALPDGRMYYNIANRTVRPMLANNHASVNRAAKSVQARIDEEAGIGLGVLDGDSLEDRIDGIVEAVTTEPEYMKWLDEPIKNCTEAFFDSFIEENANFRDSVGLKTMVIRVPAPNCCPWCAGLGGEFTYPLENRDVFRRHQFCRCTTTFVCGKERQNVWSKRKWEVSDAEMQKRREAGLDVFRLTPEEAARSVAEQRQRDEAIRRIMRERRVTRDRAARIYRSQTKTRR